MKSLLKKIDNFKDTLMRSVYPERYSKSIVYANNTPTTNQEVKVYLTLADAQRKLEDLGNQGYADLLISYMEPLWHNMSVEQQDSVWSRNAEPAFSNVVETRNALPENVKLDLHNDFSKVMYRIVTYWQEAGGQAQCDEKRVRFYPTKIGMDCQLTQCDNGAFSSNTIMVGEKLDLSETNPRWTTVRIATSVKNDEVQG